MSPIWMSSRRNVWKQTTTAPIGPPTATTVAAARTAAVAITAQWRSYQRHAITIPLITIIISIWRRRAKPNASAPSSLPSSSRGWRASSNASSTWSVRSACIWLRGRQIKKPSTPQNEPLNCARQTSSLKHIYHIINLSASFLPFAQLVCPVRDLIVLCFFPCRLNLTEAQVKVWFQVRNTQIVWIVWLLALLGARLERRSLARWAYRLSTLHSLVFDYCVRK